MTKLHDMETADNDQRPLKRMRLSPSLEQHISTYNTTGGSMASQLLPMVTSQDEIDLEAKEREVGISAYVSETPVPFRALLKTRYTDFLVNEILPDGRVVHLTNTQVPDALRSSKAKPPKEEVVRDRDESLADSHKDLEEVVKVVKDNEDEREVGSHPPAQEQVRISEEDKQKLISYFNEKVVSELLSLYQAVIKNPQKKAKDHPKVHAEFTSDRTLRGEIHKSIREIFASKIDSSTDQDGVLVLTAANPNSRYNRPQKNNVQSSIRPGKLGWADRGGEYLHFTLYKENKDTMEAISWLVRQMKMNAKVFQFAGTKDRRAVTAQRVSAHRVDAERLASQNRSLRNATVGDFEYQPHGLDLGDLSGNEFTITLRDCRFPDTEALSIEERIAHAKQNLQTALDNLHTKGYLNYYGLQRFGTFLTRTDTTGLHILKSDFKSACEAILEYDPSILPSTDSSTPNTTAPTHNPRNNSSDDLHRALAIATYKKDNNLHACLDLLPRKFSAEITLLRHLHKSPQDYFGALMSIHRNLRTMYVHAYQSLVWNHALTYRVQTHGTSVIEGDLVLVSEHKSKLDPTLTTDPAASTKEAETVDADGEIILPPSTNDKSSSADDLFERARPLSSQEVSSNLYSIFDVVLPLPGFDIVYPSNPVGEFYTTFMRDHGALDPMDMRRKQRDFSLSGSYRKIVSRVLGNKGEVDVVKYRSDTEQFVKTDLEVLKEGGHGGAEGGIGSQSEAWRVERERLRTETNGNGNGNGDAGAPTTNEVATDMQMEDEEKVEVEEEKIAAILKFQLGSSQYATMALRELSRGGVVAYKPDFGVGRG